MGQHDPLDGFITYLELQATAPVDAETNLEGEIDEIAGICAGKSWVTDDPLGLGGLLSDVYRLAQLVVSSDLQAGDLLEDLLAAAGPGLDAYVRQEPLTLPFPYRLAFRELGLSLGLQAVGRWKSLLDAHVERFRNQDRLHALTEALAPYLPLREEIETYWLRRAHRQASSWTGHQEINMVMLASSLAPDGFLEV
jgi:hypothetical protein